MNKNKHILLIFSTAILITLFQVIFSPSNSWEHYLNLSLGQIAERDIEAPLEFEIYKSKEKLIFEQEEAARQVKEIYKLSDDITFNALRNLDIIFRHFEKPDSLLDSDLIRKELLHKGYILSNSSCEYLISERLRRRLYDYSSEKLARIFEIGIYPENFSESRITVQRKNAVRDYNLFKLYALNEAKDKLIDGFSTSAGKKTLSELADNVLVVNIIYAENLTEQEKEKARIAVSQTAGKVLKNETIVRKGERIREEEVQILDSMKRALQDSGTDRKGIQSVLSALGTFLSLILLLFVFKQLLSVFFELEKYTLRQQYLMYVLVLSISVITIVICNWLKFTAMFLPLLLFILIVMQLFDRDMAFIFAFIQFILVIILTKGQYQQPLLLTVSSLSALIVPNYNKLTSRYLSIGIYVITFTAMFSVSFGMNQILSFSIILHRLINGIISVVVSTILAIVIIPFLKKQLDILTKEQLLELLNLDYPLLKRLSVETPGTYHHSLVVGNLAESAAESIGANHLLARVGSYYHDIGKLNNSQIFIENNSAASQIHDSMLPSQSAFSIKKHISDGIQLAKNAGLPIEVIDIIKQHHGTSTISYFHSKAIESGLEFKEEEFHYKGPLPQTREAAIIMIADIVESHSKALNDINPQIISNLLHETVQKLIIDKQLKNSPLTLKELDQIILAMQPILAGVYSTRIEYPSDEENN